MRMMVALGALAMIGLSGCAADNYGGYTPGYGLLPDTSLRATYGEVYLGAGFRNDPYTVSVVSGGIIDASTVAGGCVGMIARTPDFQLTYDAGSLPLTFGVTSYQDATLVINGPDGRWYCDDDSGGNQDPQITFYSPRSGVYDVWVGAYAGNGGEASLFVTELAR
jgi:hypothetical protein